MARLSMLRGSSGTGGFWLMSKWSVGFGLIYFLSLSLTYKSSWYFWMLPVMYFIQRLTVDIRLARSAFMLSCILMCFFHVSNSIVPHEFFAEPAWISDGIGVLYFGGFMALGNYYYRRQEPLT